VKYLNALYKTVDEFYDVLGDSLRGRQRYNRSSVMLEK